MEVDSLRAREFDLWLRVRTAAGRVCVCSLEKNIAWNKKHFIVCGGWLAKCVFAQKKQNIQASIPAWMFMDL